MTTTVNVTATNLLTGETIQITAPAHGWRNEAKHQAAHRWSVCWDSIKLEQMPPAA